MNDDLGGFDMEKTEEEVTLEAFVRKTSPSLSEKEVKKQVEVIEKAFKDGIPPKDSLGFTRDSIEFLYGQGHRLYMMRHFNEASRFFHLLYTLDASDPRFALGIAACYHGEKDFQNAMAWYIALSLIDASSPMPFYYLSDCAREVHDPEAELFFLKKCVEVAGKNSEYEALKERVLRSIPPLEEEFNKVKKT